MLEKLIEPYVKLDHEAIEPQYFSYLDIMENQEKFGFHDFFF